MLTITVLGGGGNTGRRVASSLLDRGLAVRVVGRDESRLAPLVRRGALAAVGNVADPRFLKAAFRGAHAAYVLLAPDASAADYPGAQDEMGESICAALAAEGVPRVVALSSLGADKDGASGVIRGLHRQELRLAKLNGVSVCTLRPASFFENVLPHLERARTTGVLADVYAPALKMPMVAAQDIGVVAASALVEPGASGPAVRELLGPVDASHEEIATAVGQALGIDVRYVRIADETMMHALVGAGASRSFASAYLEMTRAINDRMLEPVAGRHAANTTDTTFKRFLEAALV